MHHRINPSDRQSRRHHGRGWDHVFFMVLIFLAIVLLLVSIVVNLRH